MPIRQAAKRSGITYGTLWRNDKKSMNINPHEVRFSPNYACRQVFTDAEEKILKEYLITACQIHYCKSRKALRKLVLELAVRNGKTYPTSWDKNQCAGEDWFGHYMERHRDISLRTPENTSLSRATSFNKTNCY